MSENGSEMNCGAISNDALYGYLARDFDAGLREEIKSHLDGCEYTG